MAVALFLRVTQRRQEKALTKECMRTPQIDRQNPFAVQALLFFVARSAFFGCATKDLGTRQNAGDNCVRYQLVWTEKKKTRHHFAAR